MKTVQTPDEAVKNIQDGATIMIGGFMCCGQTFRLIDALLQKKTGNLTVISNDGGLPGIGIAKLIEEGRISRFIASHIGLNPAAGRKMNSGEMKVELIPQGTLAERIRCGGAGLGGVLTPTGIGTEVEKGKDKLTVDGREYLLEKPLRADFAFIKAKICDRNGNAFIAKAAKNFNVVMAMAARHTIVETEKLVETGELDQDSVSLPGVFVNAIVR